MCISRGTSIDYHFFRLCSDFDACIQFMQRIEKSYNRENQSGFSSYYWLINPYFRGRIRMPESRNLKK